MIVKDLSRFLGLFIIYLIAVTAYRPQCEETVFRVHTQARHKLAHSATEIRYSLLIEDKYIETRN